MDTKPRVRVTIQFDLSVLPQDVTAGVIQKAELSLFCAYSTGEEAAGSLRLLTKAWNVSEVTWENATASVPWTTPGGDNSGQVSQTPFGPVESWDTYDVKYAIRLFLLNPATNFGFLIGCLDDFNNVMDAHCPNQQYISSDNSEFQDLRPRLILTYDTDGIINLLSSNVNGKEILVNRTPENIKLFIPFNKSYKVSFSDIKGRNILSFNGNKEKWHHIPANSLSAGMHIISISLDGQAVHKKFLMIR
jgi:hypothetical protein